MRKVGKLEGDALSMSKGWKVERLGDVCEIDNIPNRKKNLPYVGLEHIESKTGKFIGSTEPQNVKSMTFNFSDKHVLYGRLRPYLKKVLLPDFEGHCSSEIFPLKVSNQLDRRFLFHWLLSDETTEKINATSTGARMPRANMNYVLDFEIPIPPLPEQQRIVSVLDATFLSIAQAKSNAERNLVNARELFESYLHEIFETPGKNWETCPLDKYVKFIDYRGHTPTKTQSGMRLITAKNVKLGYLQRTPEEFVDPKIYDKWMVRGFPKKGDVLFTTEAPLANVAQLDSDEKILFAQRIIILQPQQEKIDQTYLKYLLLSQPIRKRIFSKGTGATVQGIKARLLKTVEIYFPPLAEQRAIVGRLEALSAETGRLEEIYEAKVESLEELKRSVLQKAFEGEL
jgi:type I restriction enzyme S subunit